MDQKQVPERNRQTQKRRRQSHAESEAQQNPRVLQREQQRKFN